MKRFFLSILITAGIIYLLFTQISVKDLYHLLRSVDLFWTLCGLASYLVGLLFRALRCRWLIHSRKVPLSDLFRISVLYNLSLMILPSKLGELSYPYLLNKVSGINMTEGLASLIASRVFDFFALLMLFFPALIGSHDFFGLNLAFVLPLVAFLAGLTVLAFFYMSSLLTFFSKALGRLSQTMGPGKGRFFHWTRGKISAVADDFSAIKARRAYLPVTLTSFASWIMAFLMFYAFLRGFGVSISFFRVIFGSTVAMVVNALPIGGLGNWGILEAGWTAGFLVVGLTKVKAITTGFGVHLLIFLCSGVIGFLCWVTLGNRAAPSQAANKRKR